MKVNLCAVLVTAVILSTLVACGGAGSSAEITPLGDGPAIIPEPTARLLSLSPANGEAVGCDVKPIITLTVTHATGINSPLSGLSFFCNSREIAFTFASVLSADRKILTVTISPKTGAIFAGESCTVSGDLRVSGQGGGFPVPTSMAFSIMRTSGSDWKTYTNSQYGFSLKYPDINARLKTIGGWTNENEPKVTSRTPFNYDKCVLEGDGPGSNGSKITIAGREYCLITQFAKEPGPNGPTDSISSSYYEYISHIGNEDIGIAFLASWRADGQKVDQEARSLFEQVLSTLSTVF